MECGVKKIAIATYAKLGIGLGDEGCLTSVQCLATCTGHFIKISQVERTKNDVDKTASSTRNSTGYTVFFYFNPIIQIRVDMTSKGN